MKKRFGLLAALCLFFGVLGLAGAGVGEDLLHIEPGTTVYPCGDFRYIVRDDGTAAIVRYYGKTEELVIPGEMDGLSVTGADRNAFLELDELKKVTLPDSLKDFVICPFVRCRNLTEIVVSPDHPYLEVIDGVLFSRAEKKLLCYPLGFTAEKYIIPPGTKEIEEYAFYFDDNLKEIIIPDSMTEIGEAAFNCCYRLERVTIPDGVTKIGPEAFRGCDCLEEVRIPESVTEIADNAFLHCPEKLTIFVRLGSYAETFCKEQGLNYIVK